MAPAIAAVTYSYEDMFVDVCSTFLVACICAALVWAVGAGIGAAPRRVWLFVGGSLGAAVVAVVAMFAAVAAEAPGGIVNGVRFGTFLAYLLIAIWLLRRTTGPR